MHGKTFNQYVVKHTINKDKPNNLRKIYTLHICNLKQSFVFITLNNILLKCDKYVDGVIHGIVMDNWDCYNYLIYYYYRGKLLKNKALKIIKV